MKFLENSNNQPSSLCATNFLFDKDGYFFILDRKKM